MPVIINSVSDLGWAEAVGLIPSSWAFLSFVGESHKYVTMMNTSWKEIMLSNTEKYTINDIMDSVTITPLSIINKNDKLD